MRCVRLSPAQRRCGPCGRIALLLLSSLSLSLVSLLPCLACHHLLLLVIDHLVSLVVLFHSGHLQRMDGRIDELGAVLVNLQKQPALEMQQIRESMQFMIGRTSFKSFS